MKNINIFKTKRIQEETEKSLGENDLSDDEHMMVKSKPATNTCEQRRLLKPIYPFKKKTYLYKLDLKRLKQAPESDVGLSVFIYTPNSKP